MLLDQKIHPVFDAKGEVSRLAIFASDITVHKWVEEVTEQLARRHQLILEAAGEGIYGLDTQGRGIFYPEGEVFGEDTLTVARYDIKAIGVYLVASKNWNMLGNLGTHFGICKNFLEEDETDRDINFFFGIDKDINPNISAFIEYNAAFDDNEYSFKEISFGQGRGYLNAAIRFSIATNLYMEVDLNDILVNKGQVKYFSRELKVVYNEYF